MSDGCANSFSDVISLRGVLAGADKVSDSRNGIIGSREWVSFGLLKSVGVVLDRV